MNYKELEKRILKEWDIKGFNPGQIISLPDSLNYLSPIQVAYRILKKLGTPFHRTKAYALGIIDAKGNVLKKSSELTTTMELDAWQPLDILCNNIKKLLQQYVPQARSKLSSYKTALFLLQERKNAMLYDDDLILLEKRLIDFINDYGDLSEEEEYLAKKMIKKIEEDGECCSTVTDAMAADNGGGYTPQPVATTNTQSDIDWTPYNNRIKFSTKKKKKVNEAFEEFLLKVGKDL